MSLNVVKTTRPHFIRTASLGLGSRAEAEMNPTTSRRQTTRPMLIARRMTNKNIVTARLLVTTMAGGGACGAEHHSYGEGCAEIMERHPRRMSTVQPVERMCQDIRGGPGAALLSTLPESIHAEKKPIPTSMSGKPDVAKSLRDALDEQEKSFRSDRAADMQREAARQENNRLKQATAEVSERFKIARHGEEQAAAAMAAVIVARTSST